MLLEKREGKDTRGVGETRDSQVRGEKRERERVNASNSACNELVNI